MLGALLVLAALGQAPDRPSDPPRVVVVVSVDQMRADYIGRFAGQLTGGLKTLLRDGAVFTDAHQDHAVTHTAPGHATISTGVFPSRSGIVANDWWDRIRQRSVYAVDDPAAAIVGDAMAVGRSPVNLLRSAIGDWLKEASPASKVFSVAIKDRAAILMGGQQPDGVYWYEYDSGRFVTSTHYRADYPGWVTTFNDSGPVNDHFASGWSRLLPIEAYYLSREDEFAAEGDQPLFPHLFGNDVPGPPYYRQLPYTPFGDELVFTFAQGVVSNEDLGADAVPDLLFIGASAADYIGHRYGPYSQEVQDYYLRLDGYLADLFAFLDARVGAGRYAVVLTSDHGVLPMPEELGRRSVESRRVGSTELQEAIVPPFNQAMAAAGISATPSIRLVVGLAVGFVDSVPPDKVSALRKHLAESMGKAEFFAETFTYDELLSPKEHRPFVELYRRSFHPDRAPDVWYRVKRHYLLGMAQGTTHGSPYRYDTHVPLIFWGPGIVQGSHGARVRAVDIAPTLAALLGIPSPGDLDGRSLVWALQKGN